MGVFARIADCGSGGFETPRNDGSWKHPPPSTPWPARRRRRTCRGGWGARWRPARRCRRWPCGGTRRTHSARGRPPARGDPANGGCAFGQSSSWAFNKTVLKGCEAEQPCAAHLPFNPTTDSGEWERPALMPVTPQVSTAPRPGGHLGSRERKGIRTTTSKGSGEARSGWACDVLPGRKGQPWREARGRPATHPPLVLKDPPNTDSILSLSTVVTSSRHRLVMAVVVFVGWCQRSAIGGSGDTVQGGPSNTPKHDTTLSRPAKCIFVSCANEVPHCPEPCPRCQGVESRTPAPASRAPRPRPKTTHRWSCRPGSRAPRARSPRGT